MESFSKTYCYVFFLICMLFISLTTPILGCGSCNNPPKKTKPSPGSKSPKGPITLPPIIVNPPVTLPPIIGKPPVTIPPVIGKPPVTIPPVVGKPPVTIPPVIGKPPITLPPIDLPPINLPPVQLPPVPIVTNPPSTGTGKGKGKPCQPKVKETCPIDTIKLGSCVDLLGGLVHIGLGDPAVNECCPVLEGLVDVEAAACLCTTLKFKALNLNIYVPIALQLLISCGKTPPPGYTCSL